MTFSSDIPPIECWVRAEYMRQHRDSVGQFVEACVFGVSSLVGQVPLFHFVTLDGGIWWRMPVSAFVSRKDAPRVPLHNLVLWDSFSYSLAVTQYEFLKNKRMEYRDRENAMRAGAYLFTLDWVSPSGAGFAETPGQHKCGHVIALDDGNFAIQPNNRLLVFDPSFTTRYGKPVIERLTSDRRYTVEQTAKHILSDDAKYDYGIE